MTARLILLSHGATSATLGARFPDDEPLDAAARARLTEIAGTFRASGRVLSSPALAARQTAAYLSPDVAVDEALADCDHGRWKGRNLAQIHEEEPENLAAWMSDPTSASHGGESVTGLIERVSGWLDAQHAGRGRMIAVTHGAVIRAAVISILDAPASAFWRIDIEPLGSIELTSNKTRWALRVSAAPSLKLN
jgi:broad specificity phosphatase PhoE